MRAQTQTNKTDTASTALYLGGAGAALWLLVLALEPDVGFTAPCWVNRVARDAFSSYQG
jgi:hypothetical protein